MHITAPDLHPPWPRKSPPLNQASLQPMSCQLLVPSWQDPLSSAIPPPPGLSSLPVLEHSHSFVWTRTDSPNLRLRV